MKFKTLDDVDVRGKKVLVRVDINSPLDPETGEILDDTRIRECSRTLKELLDKGAKLVILAHQGRPGSEDFTTLERHSKKLSEVLGREVKYVDDVFGSRAKEAIGELKEGEAILLENVRFYSEEVLKRPAEEQANTHMVRELSKVVDIYVNDAFAAAHRSQPSLVGFGVALPAVAGRLMERELRGLGKALKPERPCVYLLGGAKIEDSFSLIENVFAKGTADMVLSGGLVGQAFLSASGYDIGKVNLDFIIKKSSEEQIERAKKLLSDYGEKIKLPVDLVIDEEGNPREITIDQLPVESRISDIGHRTVEEFSKLIKEAKTVVANGPVGVFEKPEFAEGTRKLLQAMGESDAFTIIGGGHMVAAAKEMGLADKIDHVSTGGGACLRFLSGEKLPVVEVLERSAEKW
ncbi:MAG: phosphoglycerate kinase [Hadesarchaea archaeon]|nr:phosphoglycerate kinase [Hadesarchaea archaeon]